MEAAWLAIMSTFTLLLPGDVHTARTGARLAGSSLLLSPPQWPGRPGAGELSLAQLQLSERPDTEHHTADTGDWTGEHVIF